MNTPRLNDQAVENGVLKRVSPSQIKTFRSCHRKWWFEKVARAPAPRWTAATNLGTSIHTELENYYLHGHEPQHPLIQPGRHLLPERHPEAQVEIQLADSWLYAGAVLVTGFIDLVLPHTTPLQIVDWKSTSNIAKYGKTRYDLSTDVQMVIYAKWAQHRYDVDEVQVSHVQFQTKGDPLARRVDWEHTVDTVSPLWLSIEQDVAEMSRCAGLKTAEEVTPNQKACNDYGGCPYRSICTATANGARNMSLLDKLKNKAAPVTPAPEKPADPPIEHTVIAPDAALDDTPVATVAPEKPKDPPANEDRVLRQQPPAAAAIQSADPTPAPKSPAEPPAKRKPGRPRKNPATETKIEDVIKSEQATEARLCPQPGRDTTPENSPRDLKPIIPGKVGLHLYINCRPDHATQSLAPFVAEVAAEVAKTCDVPDVRLCGGDLGYNKWKGACAAVAASKAPHGEFHVISGEVEDAVVSGLIPLASVVVRGVR